ncbi:Lob domain-containing protein crl1 [Thalictrum thalictroides]|uniref:Lob domain-containing protein crl1 n=1 Tax=Thalictrum thalictroides TaxID=46969 RepID=A0A7J6WER6_THATH|nr:Lob domain-containing protein crl1 [Thalictrum thalictroides]
MTGFGSPCGACKFLRRKCVRGCVFAPYFCHEEGATHFSAIHRVFGASNVSKLLTQLPVSDRSEAAVTISYEALARLQDPIYGCVSHIFALQQQVVNLQAQLAFFKDQAAQNLVSGCSTTSSSQEQKLFEKFHTFPSQDIQGFIASEMSASQQQFHPNPNNSAETLYHVNELRDPNSLNNYHHMFMPGENDSYNSLEDPSAGPVDMHTNISKWGFQDAEDLQSVAFPYL